MTETPARSELSADDLSTLHGIPYGESHRDDVRDVLWGSWSDVGDPPALAVGGRNFIAVWTPGRVEWTRYGDEADSLWGSWGYLGPSFVLAAGGSDGVVRFWDPARPEQLGGDLKGAGAPVIWGDWVRVEGRPSFVTVGRTGPTLWTFGDAQPERRDLDGSDTPLTWAACCKNGGLPLLAAGGESGPVRFWDLVGGKPFAATVDVGADGSDGGAWSVVGGEPTLATIGSDHRVSLFDQLATRPRRRVLAGHTAPVHWAAWGRADGHPLLATGGQDRTIRIWDPVSGQQVGDALDGHATDVDWGAWADVAGTAVLATGDFEGSVRLWDPLAGRPFGEVLISLDASRWGGWSSVDGRPILATVGVEPVVRRWELVTERSIGADLPNYRSDALTPTDQLGRSADAVAVAELITARSARPPLAVGLFGDWGEGKSHFMGLLQRQVAAVAETPSVLAHRHVRQVRFNAWHYAETDLWASLVAELFAQLGGSESGAEPIGQRQQSRLAAELIAQRGLPDRLAAARARRDELRATLDRPGQLWMSLPQAEQWELNALFGEKPERLYAEAVRATAVVAGTGRLSWRLLRGLRPSLIARVVLALLLVAVAGVALVWWLPPASRLIAAVPGVVALLAAAEAAIRLTRDVRRRGSAAWRTAMDLVARQSRRLTAAADAADAEVTELQRQMQDFTAAGQLAGVIAERAASGDYRSRLDLMSRIREDFERMSRLLAVAGAEPPGADEVGDELPRIDRIVVYIDDLDRCPPERVVELLEAVHLLLAVDLFVVVVAVDPRWLLAAIGSHYRDVLTVDDDVLGPSTPAQYLEKIFQVVLTLPPLENTGYQRMLRGLVGTRSDDPVPTPQVDAEAAPPPSTDEPASTGDESRATGVSLDGPRLPRPRQVDRVDPFALDPDEIRLLDLLGPPRMISTPRQVKRLANSYGLLTALRRAHRPDDLAEQYGLVRNDTGADQAVSYRPYRAGLVLLAALVAYPALGPDFFKHLHGAAAADPQCSWSTYLAESSGSWPVLIDALTFVTTAAAGRELPLPEPLAAWADWIVPVGRLSFPTGRVVNALR